MVVACRPVCERVQSACQPFMGKQAWPAALNCSLIPHERNGVDTLCIDNKQKRSAVTDRPRAITAATKRRDTPPPPPKPPVTSLMAKTTRQHPPAAMTRRVHTKDMAHRPPVVRIQSTRTYCHVLYARNELNYFYVERIRACALECEADGAFSQAQKLAVERWLTGLAFLTALLCATAVFAVVFEYRTTNFPERAIVFITVCYFFYACAFIARIVIGREGVSCQREHGRAYLLLDGSGNITCAATFLLAYTFSMAQCLWWVVLSLCWFLRAGLRWDAARVKAKSAYFHFFAWAAPCAKTVLVLILRRIDVDELTGVCFVGARYENLDALRGFILGPLFTYLVMGALFLVSGFVARFIAAVKSGSTNTPDPKHADKLDGHLYPAGIYAALHTFFSTYILASYFYEYVHKDSWFRDPLSSGPNFDVFLLRIIMDFAIGVSSSLWLLVRHVPRLCTRLCASVTGRQLAGGYSSSGEPLRAGTHETASNETSI